MCWLKINTKWPTNTDVKCSYITRSSCILNYSVQILLLFPFPLTGKKKAGEETNTSWITLIKENFDNCWFFINLRNIYEACRLAVSILRIHKYFLNALNVLYWNDRLLTLAVQFNWSYAVSVLLLPDKFSSKRIVSEKIKNKTLIKYMDPKNFYSKPSEQYSVTQYSQEQYLVCWIKKKKKQKNKEQNSNSILSALNHLVIQAEPMTWQNAELKVLHIKPRCVFALQVQLRVP